MPAQLTWMGRLAVLLLGDVIMAKKPYSIVYPSCLRDDRIDKGVDEALVGDITGSGKNHDFAIDLRKLFSCAFKLLFVDVRNGDTFATSIDECFRYRSSNAL
jgi:hypothetical protein